MFNKHLHDLGFKIMIHFGIQIGHFHDESHIQKIFCIPNLNFFIRSNKLFLKNIHSAMKNKYHGIHGMQNFGIHGIQMHHLYSQIIIILFF